jgi:thiamine-monophosphate kinase
MASSLDPDAKISWLSEALASSLPPPFKMIAGVGDDDCAAIDLDGSTILVLTSDYVNAQPIMVTLGLGSFYELGRYLVNSNLADLCGSGAKPLALLISVMWNRDQPSSAFEQFMAGAKATAESAGARIIGGDTKLSSHAAYCAVAVGTAEDPSRLFLKQRARPGYGVWASGRLGSCSAAVYGLQQHFGDPTWREWARSAIADPVLPIQVAQDASALGMTAAGTDLSDGLGADLASLCDASRVGVEIFAQAIPLADGLRELAAQQAVPPHAFAFTVGGDLQFILCADDQYSARLDHLGLARIGTIHADPDHRKLVTADGRVTNMPSIGHRDAHAMTFAEEIGYLLRLQGYE